MIRVRAEREGKGGKRKKCVRVMERKTEETTT